MQVLTADCTRVDAGEVFASSLHETGFALVANASLDPDLLDEFYTLWAAFFAGREKYDCPSDPSIPAGYLPYRAVDGRLVDLKESFYYAPNRACPGVLRETTAAVHRCLFDLAETLLNRLIAHDSPECPDLWLRLTAEPRTSVLRVLHYPAMADIPEWRDRLPAAPHEPVRLAGHQDLNLLTVLPPATMPGLDIMDRDGAWHRVACDAAAMIVNAGDALQRLSGGYYRSTRHRVRNTIAELERSRYATALFLV